MRNNLERLGLESKSPQDDNSAATSALNFVVPTEIVDLPSKGLYYPEGHPLHYKDTIEIRYMTAKDEDTLTNQSLLKKGLALEKVLQDIIIDKSIKTDNLLLGDKNAIIIAARRSAYGADYETKVTCPSCGKVQQHTFDLNNQNPKAILTDEELNDLGVNKTENNTFIFNLPLLKTPVEIRLLTGKDELYISQKNREAQQAKKDLDSVVMQLKLIIKSINNIADPNVIAEACTLLPAKDSKTIRQVYNEVAPNLELVHNFECKACSFETRMEVPFTADFFWPK
jgi:hypothetical protein